MLFFFLNKQWLTSILTVKKIKITWHHSAILSVSEIQWEPPGWDFTCSTLHSLSTCFWYLFIQSSAKWRCVEYLLSSFWYCGIFFNICDRSRMLAFSPSFIRLSWANCFNCFVTCLRKSKTYIHIIQQIYPSNNV